MKTLTATQIREIADKFAGSRCWLLVNGVKCEAKVTGRLNDHATISPLLMELSPVEFSWAAVARIMATRETTFVA